MLKLNFDATDKNVEPVHARKFVTSLHQREEFTQYLDSLQRQQSQMSESAMKNALAPLTGYPGKLIVVEGIDGTGKTTQLGMMKAYLKLKSVNFITTKSPGGSDFGNEIRKILFETIKTESIWPDSMELLFLASHLHNLYTIIVPVLESGTHVIADRHWPSSVAYAPQRESSINIKSFYHHMRGMDPDLMILLTADPAVAFERANIGSGREHQKGKSWNSVESFAEVQKTFIKEFSWRNWTRTVDATDLSANDLFELRIRPILDQFLNLKSEQGVS